MKLFKAILCTAAVAASLSAFAAKPKLMVLPDLTWAQEMGYGHNEDAMGETRYVIDYNACFADPDFKTAVTAIGSLFQDEDYPLESYVAKSGARAKRAAASQMHTNKQTGGTSQRTAYDEIMSSAAPDITLELGWNKKKQGFDYQLTVRLIALDAYSSKEVATIQGPSPLVDSSVSVGDLLQSVINSKFSEFTGKLNRHFNDLETNGREINIVMEILDSAATDFDTEFGDDTLSTIIYDWLSENTVNGKFSESTSTENLLEYDQVRIPLTDERGRALQAKGFVDQLKKHLRNTYGLETENRSSGLGEGYLYFPN